MIRRRRPNHTPLALRFDAPVALDPQRGVFIFAEAAPGPLHDFDPHVLDVIPCPVEWQAETPAQRRARLQRRRQVRQSDGWV